ncbi:hypothetical protein BCR33DRAFT_418292 [Rhizoclosmatium globosum]|uniref:Uncharacterized protein n=1 Tax=Rhizoclosmatium globosum TaxID=329046 RepID=A0A1Y2BWT9_9FUNG|nr:hypothetical protein BCR33DRAFT_418292 [Rhizoclosmatium globosum]|eukprot:ORY39117.1 hypothetical protein BCR33DRAFT_418292 [Rhizoclosmatium globosum]
MHETNRTNRTGPQTIHIPRFMDIHHRNIHPPRPNQPTLRNPRLIRRNTLPPSTPSPPLLPPETQTLIKSVPKYITDTNENVRAVSCFVGGVYISEHDYLRRDRAFMEALGEALVSVREDGDVTVRVRGVWAVANLGDALVAGVAEGEGVGLSKGVVKGLVGCAVFGAGDHEKCRGNGVRALGNFFRVAEKDCFSEGLVKEVDLIVRNLNAGPFKTRWNADTPRLTSSYLPCSWTYMISCRLCLSSLTHFRLL